MLNRYDIVFAKARSAIEALVTGCAVVVSDYSRIGGMVTTANLDELRRLNFGVRTLQKPLSRETVRKALASYDPDDASKVSATMRSTASLTEAADQYLAVYDEVLRGWEDRPDTLAPREALALASNYLRWLSPVIKDRNIVRRKAEQLGSELASMRSTKMEADAAAEKIEELQTELAVACSETATLWQHMARRDENEAELTKARSETATLRQQVVRLEEELAMIKNSRAWRAVQVYGRIRQKFWKPR
jgi:hypothetical protein